MVRLAGSLCDSGDLAILGALSGPCPSYDELVLLLQQQQRHIDALTAEVARLHALLEEARRASKRQAAPFRKGPPKPDPQRPGRKAGDRHGTHGHRPPPLPDQIDEVHEAPLALALAICTAR